MVVVALTYGVVMVGADACGSGRCVWLRRRKNEAKAIFRFALMRLRDNAESVALMAGPPRAGRSLRAVYDTVVARWIAIVRQHGHLTWITNSGGPMMPIVPLLFAAPKYFSGELSLGEVTQLAGAFVQVQMAISWLVDNYNRVAEWYASARRVMDILADACDGSDCFESRLGADSGIAATARRGAHACMAGSRSVDPARSAHLSTAPACRCAG